ncbi:hypothetical protein, partial [Inquilinus limosus]
MTAGAAARLRGLPSVDQVLKTPEAVAALAAFGHAQTAAAVVAAWAQLHGLALLVISGQLADDLVRDGGLD